MKNLKFLLSVFIIPIVLFVHSSVATAEAFNNDLNEKITYETEIDYMPSGNTAIERAEDMAEYMRRFTGNLDISFEGFITDDKTHPISKTPTIVLGEDNRIKADPTISPYKQCGYLETHFLDGSSLYMKQGTGALIDRDRFVTAGSMVYAQEDFKGWPIISTIWIASQDGRGTLTDDPYSGMNAGISFTSMNGWINSADPRYDMGYITMNTPSEHLAGRLNYAVPTEGAVLSHVVSYTGNLMQQIMWGNQTFAINTPELIFHDVTVSHGSIGAPIIQNSSIVGITTTLDKQGPMSQALAIRPELYSFFSPN